MLRTVFKTVKAAPLKDSKPLSQQLSGEKGDLLNKFKEYTKQRDQLKQLKMQLKLKEIMPDSLKDQFQKYIEGDITERDMVEAIRTS